MGTFARFMSIFYITGYGTLSFSYYILGTVFALLNRRRVEKTSKKCQEKNTSIQKPSVSVHVVGYREDPDYFEKCLLSVKNLSYSNIISIIVCVDGNEEEDMYMAEIARNVFGSSVIHLQPSTVPAADPSTFDIPIDMASCPIYIVTQPHMGKREAIYSSYMISKKIGADFFLNTDSDTIMETNALDELVYMTVEKENVDAVAGQLKIFNKINCLSYLSAARYFMAFNIERAAQSFHGVVGCISGPLGIYRLSSVETIVDDWVNQSFMGIKCTFGDDRHLTNKILSIGGDIVYTHRSIAYKETPTVYSRFVSQQTRWSKSYWRELFHQSKWASRHWLLMVETVYGVLFPVLITVTLIRVIYTRTWWSLFSIFAITFTFPFLRACIVFLLFEREPLVFLNALYPLLYFTTLLPVKFVALASVTKKQLGYIFKKGCGKHLRPHHSRYHLDSYRTGRSSMEWSGLIFVGS